MTGIRPWELPKVTIGKLPEPGPELGKPVKEPVQIYDSNNKEMNDTFALERNQLMEVIRIKNDRIEQLEQMLAEAETWIKQYEDKGGS